MSTRKPSREIENALTVSCPTCNVSPGMSCRAVKGTKIPAGTVWAHGLRILIAKKGQLTPGATDAAFMRDAAALVRELAKSWRTYGKGAYVAREASELCKKHGVEP